MPKMVKVKSIYEQLIRSRDKISHSYATVSVLSHSDTFIGAIMTVVLKVFNADHQNNFLVCMYSFAAGFRYGGHEPLTLLVGFQ